MYSNNLILYTYYSVQAAHYKHVAHLYERIYDKWQEKEDTFDRIDQSTSELFVKNSAMREIVTECLKDIQSVFTSKHFSQNMGARWRFALSDEGRRRALDQVTEKEMREIADTYEIMHPEVAKQLNELLINENCELLTDTDILSIKYLAYTAEEPYRSLYLDYIGDYTIREVDLVNKIERSFFDSINNDITRRYPAAFGSDKRGAYTTFFHESGHATDYNINNGDYSLSYRYWDEKTQQEYSLLELIENDVYNNIREHIRQQNNTLTEEQVDLILDSIKYGGTEEELLSYDLREIRNSVVEEYNSELSPVTMEAVCDVYEGVTNLNIGGKRGIGHRPNEDEDISTYDYWYEDGAPTGKQCKELWAEYFSYHMAGDEEALENLRLYYPSASQALDAMAEEMAGY